MAHRRIKSNHAIRLKTIIPDHLIQHLVGIIKKLLRFYTYYFIVKNSWISSREHPCLEKRSPVDVFTNLLQWIRNKFLSTNERRSCKRSCLPVDPGLIFPCLIKSNIILCLFSVLMIDPEVRVFILHLLLEGRACQFTDQLTGYGHRSRSVENVHHRSGINGIDFYGRMYTRSGRSTDKEWQIHFFALHFLCKMYHLI